MGKQAILCVDDEDMVLSSLKRQLRRHLGNEYHIEVAQDGDEALEIIEELCEQDIVLAVVISDYIMPAMKGDELLQHIHKQFPDTMNILLTGQANMDGITNAVNYANLYRYIAKPWEQTDLILTVTEALRSFDKDRKLAEHNETLQTINYQLEELTSSLESQVIERTAELQEAYQNLKNLHMRMEDDLLLAREIQQGLLLSPQIQRPCLDIMCHSVPANEVGGDFYHYYSFGKTRFAAMVCDVSGKGVSAALLMASSLAQLDSSFGQDMTPVDRMEYLDIAISPYTKSRRQNCAMCYVEFDDLDKACCKATIVNAGCIPPYIRRTNGMVEWPDVRGFALGQGLGARLGYNPHVVHLNPYDMLILVSDGVVEAHNKDGALFGFDRFLETIAHASVTKASDMMAHLVTHINRFIGDVEPGDDITIMVIQMKQPAQ